MKKSTLILLILSLLLTLPSSHVFGAGKSAADFYKGKTVEFVIPFGVGGGTDRLSRIMIPYLEKYLDCKIVPSNKTGAGGLVGLNYLWNSKPNGLVMGVAEMMGAVWSEFVGSKAARFKTAELTLIGGIEKQSMIISTQPDSPYKTFADLINSQKPILLSVPGKMSSMHVMVALATDVWNFELKVIPGYRGAAGMMKAVEGGEVDITCNSEIPSKPRIEAGTVRPLAYVTAERQSLFPNIPAVTETPAKNKAALDRFLSAMWVSSYARALDMPPGVPADKAVFVREAFKKTLTDPALVAKGKKNGIQFIYTDQGDYNKEIEKLFGGMSEQEKDHVKKLLR